MNNELTETHHDKVSLVQKIAHQYSVDPDKMLATMKETCFRQAGKNQVSNEQMMSMLIVADQYNLNPFTRELYAFPQNGGIVPIVSIDGWMKIINSHDQYDGMDFDDTFDADGHIHAITCSIYRKDRTHPTTVTEYYSECKRSTEPWKTQPVRMLRHRATIQCARYAFGLSGINDPSVTEAPPEPIVVNPDDRRGALSQVMDEAGRRKRAGEKLGPVVKAEPANSGLDDVVGPHTDKEVG